MTPKEVGYFSPLRIPEGKSGKFSIKHVIEPVGKKITVVSMRDAVFQNKKSSYYMTKQPMRIHKLMEGTGTWMSDCPQEIYSQQEIVEKAHGKVLIGGLGLGYIAKAINDSDAVDSIDVIEKSTDVINLVWKHLDVPKARLYQADLFTYLKKSKHKKYDWAFYDIWAPTGETVLDEFVRPLRKLSKGIIKDKNILCWEEETMLGQIKFHLETDIQMWDEPMPFGRYKSCPDEAFYSPHVRNGIATTWPFLHWMRSMKPSKAEALKALDRYIKTYSDIDEWKKEWDMWSKESALYSSK